MSGDFEDRVEKLITRQEVKIKQLAQEVMEPLTKQVKKLEHRVQVLERELDEMKRKEAADASSASR